MNLWFRYALSPWYIQNTVLSAILETMQSVPSPCIGDSVTITLKAGKARPYLNNLSEESQPGGSIYQDLVNVSEAMKNIKILLCLTGRVNMQQSWVHLRNRADSCLHYADAQPFRAGDTDSNHPAPHTAFSEATANPKCSSAGFLAFSVYWCWVFLLESSLTALTLHSLKGPALRLPCLLQCLPCSWPLCEKPCSQGSASSLPCLNLGFLVLTVHHRQ